MSSKLTVLGCGNQYSIELVPTAYVYQDGNNHILINCGTRIPYELHRLDLIKKITHVVILGNDEFITGGIDTLAIRSKYVHGTFITLIKPPFLLKKISFIGGKKHTLDSLFSKVITFNNQEIKIDNITLKFYPISESRAAIQIHNGTSSVLITGETPEIEQQLVKLPYDSSDLIIQSCVFENERPIAKYQDFIDFKGNIRFTEYRDRDIITGEKILVPGEVIELP